MAFSSRLHRRLQTFSSQTLPRLRELRPELPVLLATGRADQDALDLVAAHPGVVLMPKPITIGDVQKWLQASCATAGTAGPA